MLKKAHFSEAEIQILTQVASEIIIMYFHILISQMVTIL